MSRQSTIRGAAAVVGVMALVAVTGTRAASSGGSHTQQLTGQYAQAYVAQKEQRQPKFREERKEAADDLRAQGFKPTGKIVVVRVTGDMAGRTTFLGRLAHALVAPALAQTFSTSAGEVVLETWNDGDNSTWEGHVYVENYATGDWSSFTTQYEYYYSTQSGRIPRTNWVGRTAIERDGRVRWARRDPRPGLLARALGTIFPTLLAQASDGLSCTAGPRSQVNAFMEAGWDRTKANAFSILVSAAVAGFGGGPGLFVSVGGGQVWGHWLQGYVNEFSRYYQRCNK